MQDEAERVSVPRGSGLKLAPINGGCIAYEDSGGDGAVVLAVHSPGEMRGEYQWLAPWLCSAGFRFISLDCRGHGQSSSNWGEYSSRAVGRDIVALLRRLDIQSAVLVGSSVNAAAILWAAKQAPQLVSATVLLSPILRDQVVFPRSALSLQLGFIGPWRRWYWRRVCERVAKSVGVDGYKLYRAQVDKRLAEPGRIEAVWSMLTLSRRCTEAMLAAGKPSMLIFGDQDHAFDSVAEEAFWVSCRLNAECHLLAGIGHFPHVEAPERVAEIVVPFVRAAFEREVVLQAVSDTSAHESPELVV